MIKCKCGSDDLLHITTACDSGIGNRWLCKVCDSTFLTVYEGRDSLEAYDWREHLSGDN